MVDVSRYQERAHSSYEVCSVGAPAPTYMQRRLLHPPSPSPNKQKVRRYKEPPVKADAIVIASTRAVLLAGSTLESLGLAQLSAASPNGSRSVVLQVQLSALLADIQFQGAISDWHCLREELRACKLEALAVRSVLDDAYGDGSNVEVALSSEAEAAWAAADAAAVCSGNSDADGGNGGSGTGSNGSMHRRPRGLRPPQPWQDLGSEVRLRFDMHAFAY